MASPNLKETGTSNHYASVPNFEQIFVEDMNSLYLLSLLLTGSRLRAEGCFVAGLSECVKSKRVFKDWARSWARRMIIQAAIRVMIFQENHARIGKTPAIARDFMDTLHLQMEVSAILGLAVFDRIVFVMSTLEHYSDNDCAILLSCRRMDVTAARTRALRRLGSMLGYESTGQTQGGTQDSPVEESTFETTIARYFAASLGYERISA